jgi:hypothetical protein
VPPVWSFHLMTVFEPGLLVGHRRLVLAPDMPPADQT